MGAPTVQELAGHAHLETTARYAHSRKGSARDAIDRLNGPASPSEEPIAVEGETGARGAGPKGEK